LDPALPFLERDSNYVPGHGLQGLEHRLPMGKTGRPQSTCRPIRCGFEPGYRQSG